MIILGHKNALGNASDESTVRLDPRHHRAFFRSDLNESKGEGRRIGFDQHKADGFGLPLVFVSPLNFSRRRPGARHDELCPINVAKVLKQMLVTGKIGMKVSDDMLFEKRF